jgi:predicted kinase
MPFLSAETPQAQLCAAIPRTVRALRTVQNGGSRAIQTGILPRIVTICRAEITGVSGDNAEVTTIVVSGPPATGKTTLGLALGRALAAPVFSRDPIMAVLYRRRWPLLGRGSVPAMGLELQTVLLARQLELGQPAILECVAPGAARQRWRATTAAAGHRFISVECVCTDPAEHRARFEQRPGNRRRRASGWDKVTATMRHYQQDEDADFVADAVRPVTELVAAIAELVGSQAP